MGYKLPCGVYQHYKGKRYLVIGVAKHTETGEEVVVYIPLYDVPPPQMAVRPLSMFMETVEVDGEIVNRFQYLGDY